MKLHAKDYVGKPLNIRQGRPFEPWSRGSYSSIEPLQFLIGRQWDDVALGWVHGLRPSHIRVTTGEEQLDAQTWRVTVTVNDDNVIQSIRQEVAIGLPDGVANGYELRVLTKAAN